MVISLSFREYNPHLPRGEVQQVDSLREEWRSLTELAEKVGGTAFYMKL